MCFATTHWSVVLTAAGADSPAAAAALEMLCRQYWYPLYAYVRRSGREPHDAQDLTQAFFAQLLRRDFLHNVGPEKGRFRTFLLTCLKHFLTDEWEKARTARRGGDCRPLSLDLEQAEARYHREPGGEASAESLYERRWALDLLERVLDRLRDEAASSDQDAVFEQFMSCLWGERPAETCAQVGARFGLGASAVKVAIHRLRLRCRALLREEIAHTVSRPEEVEEELRHLFAVVSR